MNRCHLWPWVEVCVCVCVCMCVAGLRILWVIQKWKKELLAYEGCVVCACMTSTHVLLFCSRMLPVYMCTASSFVCMLYAFSLSLPLSLSPSLPLYFSLYLTHTLTLTRSQSQCICHVHILLIPWSGHISSYWFTQSSVQQHTILPCQHEPTASLLFVIICE